MPAIKRRGAPSNAESNRFSLPGRQTDDDWIDRTLRVEEDALPPLRTQVTEERARTIISRNNSPDVGFSQSINAFRGCDQAYTVV
jgi:hypothetical protein